MTRLIDADAFKKENERLLHCDFPYLSETTLEELIDEAPTIDAEPVRRGKWIYGNDFHWYTASCNRCGYQRRTDIKADRWNQWNYCPNCGADMRGDNSEHE